MTDRHDHRRRGHRKLAALERIAAALERIAGAPPDPPGAPDRQPLEAPPSTTTPAEQRAINRRW